MLNGLIISETKNVCIDEAEIDAKIEDALNDICTMMGKKRKKKKINIHIKVRLLNGLYRLLIRIRSSVHDKTDEIQIKMYNVNDLDKDELHSINEKLNKIKDRTMKILIKIRDILCQ